MSIKSSRDDDSTKELKALGVPALAGTSPIDPNACKQCNGNGSIALDDKIITCPRCKGTKVEGK